MSAISLREWLLVSPAGAFARSFQTAAHTWVRVFEPGTVVGSVAISVHQARRDNLWSIVGLGWESAWFSVVSIEFEVWDSDR